MEKERGITIVNVEREAAIEDIAWKLFVNKLGLRFKKELSPEEKKRITDVPEFEYYREQAVKYYEKKQQALLNKKYPVIEVPASGKSTWMGGAYVLCFVYSKYNSNFVLKGYYNEVMEYLKKNYTHYFYHISFWHQGFSRGHWDFWKESVGIFHPSFNDKRKGKKIMVRPYGGSWRNDNISDEEMKEKTFEFKRLPKRWIPEFDKL